MNTRNKAAARFAIVQTLPIAFSYLFISVAYGMLLAQAGYRFEWALLSSGVVYAGAYQFVLATFLTSGASLVTVGLTTLLMNSRHVFYGLSFLNEFRQTGKWYPYMILALTDETYSLFCSLQYPPEVDQPRAMVWISVLCQAYWVIGSVLGAVLGNLLPVQLEGMDFCLTALFVTILIDQWKAAPSHAPALIGLTCGVVCLLAFGAAQFMLPALILTTVALVLLESIGPRKESAS